MKGTEKSLKSWRNMAKKQCCGDHHQFFKPPSTGKSLDIAFLDGILPKMSLRECNYFRLHCYTFCRVPGMFIRTIAHTKSRSSWRISEQWISKKRVLLDVFVGRILEVVSLSVARIGFLCICSVEGATVRLWRLPHDSIHIQRWLDRKLTYLSVLLSLSILMINHSVWLYLFMISIDITCTLNLIIYINYIICVYNI